MNHDYKQGFADGWNSARESLSDLVDITSSSEFRTPMGVQPRSKPKRKLSKWQSYMKSKKTQIKYKSGKDKGKLNLKAMGRAYRRKNK